MVETPTAEIILEVDQLLSQLVERPVPLGILIDQLPGGENLRAFLMALTPVGPLGIRADVEAFTSEQKQSLVIEAGFGKDRLEFGHHAIAVHVRLEHGFIAV